MVIATEADFIAVWTELDALYGEVSSAPQDGGESAQFGDYIDSTGFTASGSTAAITAAGGIYADLVTNGINAGDVGSAALAVNLAFVELASDYVAFLEAGNPPILDIAKERGVSDPGQSYHDNILGNIGDAVIQDRFIDHESDNIDVTGDLADDLTGDPRSTEAQTYGERPYFDGYAADADDLGASIAWDIAKGIPIADLEVSRDGEDPLDGNIYVVALEDDGTVDVSAFGSIQDAIDGASDGDTIVVGPGTYGGGITVDKALKIVGVPDPDTGDLPTIDGGSGTGMTISGDLSGGSELVHIEGLNFANNTVGLRVASGTDVDNVVVKDSEFHDNTAHGFRTDGGTPDVGSIEVSGSTFADNGQGGSNGSGELLLWNYFGDALLKDLVITSSKLPGDPQADKGDNGIQITGFDPSTYDVTMPVGTIVFDNVEINGSYHKPQLMIQGFSDLDGFSFTDVSLTGSTNWGDLLFVDPISSPGNDTPGSGGYPGAYTGAGGTTILDLSGITISSTSTAALGVDSRIRGSDADDTITGTNANDLLNDLAEDGIDYGGNDTVFGLAGNDILIGGDGDDSLNGGADDDHLEGGAGTDTAGYSVALTKSDIAKNGSGGWTITVGAEGTDTLAEVEIVDHASGRFLLVGNGGFATFADAAAEATQPGDVILAENADDDSDQEIDAGDATTPVDVETGAGDDEVETGSGDDKVDTGDGDDKVDTGAGDDEVDTGDGDDEVDTGDGDDTVDTGAGDDKVDTGDGDDTVDTGDGDDEVETGEGDDKVTSGDGNDKVSTGSGDDEIVGGTGNGDDIYDGGPDNDTVVYSSATNRIVVDLRAIARESEDVRGADGAGGNPDTIGELLVAGSIAASTAVGKADGVDIGTDALLSVENVIAGQGNDKVVGNNNANRLEGGDGKDKLKGLKGSDTLIGDAGKDDLKGGKGKDVLNGGIGKDKLEGGAGKDQFVFDDLGGKADKVLDFETGKDTIVLDSSVFAKIGPAGDALKGKFFEVGKKADDKKDRIIYDKKSGNLWYDADGSKKGSDPVKIAKLDKGLDLSADDFFVL